MVDRLQKVLSQRGIASRREAEKLILQGRVRLNGQVAQLGQTADLAVDQIEVDGKPLHARPALIYLLLNKPRGVVSSCADPQHRPTVLDLLPVDLAEGQGIHPVGRLDIESSGALILTNDGALTYELTHPRHQIPKTYQVVLRGNASELALERWRQGGIPLDNKPTLPAPLRVVSSAKHQTAIEITLYEGRNRQIRRIAEILGYPVLKLHRSAIGPIQLANLSSGAYRFLMASEVQSLQFNKTV
jgi:pseudouridine synthase